MSGPLSRRDALRGLGLGAAALVGASSSAGATRYRFHGVHQSGVTTPIQDHLAMAAFDVSGTRAQLVATLRDWSAAARLFVEGRPLPPDGSAYLPPADTGEALDLPAAGLTLTFGFGPSLFDARFGLSRRRPHALIDLPTFPGDRMDPLRSGGDLVVQACAQDPVVAFHAVRNLARLAEGVAGVRWLQLGAGRTSGETTGATPRNLLGFKDGTANLDAADESAMARHVWVGDEGEQSWMRGGTYLVARRIRLHLERWSALTLDTQQATIGRFRASGAPLTGRAEHDPLRLGVYDHFGQPVIPDSAHVRVVSARENDGAVILRRGFNFVDGLDPVTGELDAGLMFLCFQKEPARQFVTLQTSLAAKDNLALYATHTGSGLYACPPGAPDGGYVGQALFEG